MPPPPASQDDQTNPPTPPDDLGDLGSQEMMGASSGFTMDLEKLEAAALAAKEPLSIGKLETIPQGRGMVTMTMVFALPFVQPIPVPGLSIIMGIVIMALGLKLVFGTHGNLPEYVRRKTLQPSTVYKMARSGKKIFSKLEKLFRKRLLYLVAPPWSQVAGASLMIPGIAMALPLPPVIVFSNSMPAIAVILICLGVIERDGFFILAGHAMAVFTWLYFAFWWELIWAAIVHLPDLLPELLKKWQTL